MRIAFVVSNFSPCTGGIETHVAQVAGALSATHQVTVAAMNFNQRSPYKRLAVLGSNILAPRPRADRVDGDVKVLSLAPNWLGRLCMAPLVLRAVPRLQRWFYHQINRLTHPCFARAMHAKLARLLASADVVHTTATQDLNWATIAMAERNQMPVVCTPFAHPGQWGNGPDDVAHYNRCSAVVALVPSDRDHLTEIGVHSDLIRVAGVSPCLPASIDPQAFRHREQLTHEPVIFFIGRMMHHKGAQALLDATTLIWKAHPSARFYFAGPGSADELRIFDNRDSRIHYLGRVSDREKAEAMAACDMFCMPSTSEILPTVYLEAWSLGKPVIGGTAPGLRELVEGNGAGLVAGQTPAAIAGAVVRLLDDAALRASYGAAGRKLVEREYSTASVARQLEGIYHEVIRQTATPRAKALQPAA